MYRKFCDIPYTTLGEDGPALDIYLPEVGEGPFPVVVYFHGGSYTKGDKSEEQRLAYALPMLKGGYAVAALNYSLAPKARFPRPIVEGKAAVRFLRAHAAEFMLDPDHFIACGASAGGYFAAMLATTMGAFEYDDLSLGYPNEPEDVQAAVIFFGTMNFASLDAQFKERGVVRAHPPVASPDSPEAQLFGVTIGENPELYQKASPVQLVNSDTPPMILFHGTSDAVIPFEQSVEMAEALATAIGRDRVALHIVSGAGHSDVRFTEYSYFGEIFAFLAQNLY
ncbi:MAG: alpha/beta hydrolase fold domain-containing protein [Christensenellales bacterium]|jgi:acetyl esterase/lipase